MDKKKDFTDTYENTIFSLLEKIDSGKVKHVWEASEILAKKYDRNVDFALADIVRIQRCVAKFSKTNVGVWI